MGKRCLIAACVLVAAAFAFAGGMFSLEDIRTSTSYGPFNLSKGEKVTLNGVTYELIQVVDDRVTFRSTANGVTYGPLQVVNGRLGVIGNSTYRFGASAGSLSRPTAPQKTSAAKSTPFVPQPPAMPDRIEVPEQQAARVIAPKDLPSLPEGTDSLMGSFWFAPMDNTPLDWKIASLSGDDGSLERITLGGAFEWKYLSAGLAFSPSVKCDDIVAGDKGISRASLEDGSGFMLELGLMHPFLVDNGWKVSAGVRGQYRQDKGDITSITAYYVDETDTNGVTKTDSQYKISSSSITLRELSLWIDVELAYVSDFWGLVAGVSIQPVSEYSVSGSIPCAGRNLSVDAERSFPFDFSFGGWYDYEQWRFFSDLTIGADRRFRIGCGYLF